MKKKTERSEEINDIIDRMPMTFGRWVAIAVITFASLFLVFGWIIKYPDIVTGQIKISSDNASIKLVANASGTLQLMPFKVQEEVAEGDYIAVIKNSATTEDVQKISNLIQQFNPNVDLDKKLILPPKLSLGALNSKYYSFLAALKNKYDYEEDNVFEKQRVGLNDGILWKENILKENDSILKTSQEKLEISKKWFDKYVSLGVDRAMSEHDVDKHKNEYLARKQEEQNLKKENVLIHMQIAEHKNRLNQLDTEQKEKERKLHIDLLSSFHDFQDNMKTWEENFVLKAPIRGKIEYLKFLKENQFVQAGEEIFAIIPEESNILGQVMLPSSGAGKVELGSKVSIKLDNYPFREFGSIYGYVTSISLVSQTQKTSQSSVDTYLITVDLPEGLKTNYGQILNYKHEIGGTADIIIKDRRLMERLFDNLKHKVK